MDTPHPGITNQQRNPENNPPLRLVGRPRRFATPEQLYRECVAYFDHASQRYWPQERVVANSKDNYTSVTIKHPVPFTIQRLCLWLGIGRQTFKDYGKRAEFSGVIERVENVIFCQQFEGACLGIFSARIVARRLGIDYKHKVAQRESVNLCSPQT